MLSISRNTINIILICVLFMVAAAISRSTFVFAMIGILFLIILYLNFSNAKNTLMLPKLTIALLLFQNTLIGLGSHYGMSTNLDYIDYLTQIPTICIFTTGGCVFLMEKKNKTDFLGFLMIVLVAVFWFIGDGRFTAKVIYARNFICFYMAYLIGKHYIVTKKDVEEMIQFYINLSFAAAIFGMISMALGASFYMATGLREVYIAKNYTAYSSNGMPGNFITKVFGRTMSRLGSFYYEPVNFSYFIALGSIFSFEKMLKQKSLINIIKFIIIFAATILTFGKSGIAIAFIGMLIIYFRKLIQRFMALFGKKRARKLILAAIIIAGIGGMWYFYQYAIHGFGSYAHYEGMYNGIKYMQENPWGYGLGTFGNVNAGETGIGAVQETGLLTMGCQIGIQGMFLFIAILLSISANVNRNLLKNQNFQDYGILFIYLPIVLLLFCILQENTITPQCITSYMMFSGAFAKELKETRNGG